MAAAETAEAAAVIGGAGAEVPVIGGAGWQPREPRRPECCTVELGAGENGTVNKNNKTTWESWN